MNYNTYFVGIWYEVAISKLCDNKKQISSRRFAIIIMTKKWGVLHVNKLSSTMNVQSAIAILSKAKSIE